MRRLLAAAAALSAAVQPSSSSPPPSSRSIVSPADSLLRAVDVLSLPYASPANPPSLLVRRQDLGMDSGGDVVLAPRQAVNSSPNASLNASAWDDETNAACTKALGGLVRSTNPTGNCICYNLPSLDTASGVFEADLRVFSVWESRDAFVNVAPTDINVGVHYSGASASLVSSQDLVNMGLANKNNTITPRAEMKNPQQLQKYMFVGQIDKDRLKAGMSMAALQALVTPTLTLTAKNTRAGVVSTNVSLNEAIFLTGVFSKQVVMSDFSAARLAVDAKLEALRNGTAAFVLPGVQIMVFPIGFIITSIWLLLGLIAYGFGTYERAIYADIYRRRMRAEAAAGPVKTF